MEEVKKCIVCGNSKFKVFLTCRDHFLTQDEFTIQECENCAFRLTNPRPSEKDIYDYYKSEEYISHSNSKEGLMNTVYQIIRKLTLKRKFNLISKYISHGRILDIGCATGEFLNEFRKNNWLAYGVEPNETARNYAINNYNLEVGDENDLRILEARSFDVITMWHVLEHIAPIEQRIEEIERVLKENGLLFVAVPNSNSFDAKFYKEYWAAYDVPRHLYHFTPESIKGLFEKYAFELVAIKAMKFDSFYVSMLSEKYKYGKPKYIKAIWNGFRSNFNAAISNNQYSSLIYIFKRIDI